MDMGTVSLCSELLGAQSLFHDRQAQGLRLPCQPFYLPTVPL